MENKKIWHTPDEKLPDKGKVVVFFVGQDTRIGFYIESSKVFTDFYTAFDYEDFRITKWAYLGKLIATSKALDVAIDALKSLRDMPEEDNDRWFNYCCPHCVLQEISKIMKGA